MWKRATRTSGEKSATDGGSSKYQGPRAGGAEPASSSHSKGTSVAGATVTDGKK